MGNPVYDHNLKISVDGYTKVSPTYQKELGGRMNIAGYKEHRMG